MAHRPSVHIRPVRNQRDHSELYSTSNGGCQFTRVSRHSQNQGKGKKPTGELFTQAHELRLRAWKRVVGYTHHVTAHGGVMESRAAIHICKPTNAHQVSSKILLLYGIQNECKCQLVLDPMEVLDMYMCPGIARIM
jgi:hypothetical protein